MPQQKMGLWDQITRKKVSNLQPVNQTQASYEAHPNLQIIPKANMTSNDV